MNLVDPRPVHPSQDFDVRIGRQKLRLEPPHLAGGRSLSFDGLATNNPPHGRITSETVGVVYVLITTKATKHRLTELPRHAVPSVLAGTAVLENSPGNLGQAKGIIKLPTPRTTRWRGSTRLFRGKTSGRVSRRHGVSRPRNGSRRQGVSPGTRWAVRDGASGDRCEHRSPGWDERGVDRQGS